MKYIIALITVLLVTNAHSAGLVDGWNLRYQMDPFNKDLIAVGYASQTKDGAGFMDTAMLQVVCDKDGKLVASYSTGGFTMGNSHTVAFRFNDDEIIETTFKSTKGMGNRSVFAASVADSNSIFEALSASKLPIAFRNDDKQGEFPVAGVQQVIQSVKETCN